MKYCKQIHYPFLIIFLIFPTFLCGQDLIKTIYKSQFLVVIQATNDEDIKYYLLGSKDTSLHIIPKSIVSDIQYDHYLSDRQGNKESLLRDGRLRSKYLSPYNIIKANNVYLYNGKSYSSFDKLKELEMNEYEKELFKGVLKAQKKMKYYLYGLAGVTTGIVFYSFAKDRWKGITSPIVLGSIIQAGIGLSIIKENYKKERNFLNEYNFQNIVDEEKNPLELSFGITNHGFGIVARF